VEEAGIDAESGAILYRTSSYFLERMGLAEISDLPDIAPMLPEIDEMADADWTETVAAPHDEPDPEADDPSTDSSTGA
jgi:segregation and condensation protein B